MVEGAERLSVVRLPVARVARIACVIVVARIEIHRALAAADETSSGTAGRGTYRRRSRPSATRVHNRVPIGAMHIHAHRVHGRSLPRIQSGDHQPGQALLRPVWSQPHHLAVDEIGEHGVELLRLAPVNLIRAQVSRPSLGPCAIPFRQERVLRSTGFAPTDTVTDGCHATSASTDNPGR